jgi:hypothetical protein
MISGGFPETLRPEFSPALHPVDIPFILQDRIEQPGQRDFAFAPQDISAPLFSRKSLPRAMLWGPPTTTGIPQRSFIFPDHVFDDPDIVEITGKTHRPGLVLFYISSRDVPAFHERPKLKAGLFQGARQVKSPT